MDLFTLDMLERAEQYLASGSIAEVQPLLSELVASMEAYIDEHCAPSDTVQYFSFESVLQLLAYKRVEQDPRELVRVPQPFARAYADYAFCLLALNDPEAAVQALKQAVRWNPMECVYRLDLASVMRTLGYEDEYLRLTYSVFARASSSTHLVRAFLNFAESFEEQHEWEKAAACIKCAWRLNPQDGRTTDACARLQAQHGIDARGQADSLTTQLLEEEGIPEGANVEVVICALTLAMQARTQNDEDTFCEMSKIARDLAGAANVRTLLELIRAEESSREQASDT